MASREHEPRSGLPPTPAAPVRVSAHPPLSDEVRSALEVMKSLTEGLVEPLAAIVAPAGATGPVSAPGVERSMTPALNDTIAGAPYAVAFRPRSHVGGDYYSVRNLPLAGRTVGRFIIADVAGHDLSAAVVVAVMRVIRAALYNAPRPPTGEEIITLLNDLLTGDLARLGTFITGSIVDLDVVTGDVQSFNCGHPTPRVRSAAGGVRDLEQERTRPIGVVPDLWARPHPDHLDPGDALVLYTDGVIEARNSHGEHLGMEGLDALIAAAPADASPTDLVAHIERGIVQHEGDVPQADDRCTLVLRREHRGP